MLETKKNKPTLRGFIVTDVVKGEAVRAQFTYYRRPANFISPLCISNRGLLCTLRIQPRVHFLPYVFLLLCPLPCLVSDTRTTQSLSGPVDLLDLLKHFEWFADARVRYGGRYYERHPFVREHVCTRHMRSCRLKINDVLAHRLDGSHEYGSNHEERKSANIRCSAKAIHLKPVEHGVAVSLGSHFPATCQSQNIRAKVTSSESGDRNTHRCE